MGKFVHISFTFTLFLLFLACCKQSKYSDNYSGSCQNCIDLGCRYFIDTITIKEPLLAVYNDELYLMAERYAKGFIENPRLKEGLQMFHILPHNIRHDVMALCDPSNRTEFAERAMSQISMARSGYLGSWTSRLIFEKKEGEVELYSFKYKPARFLLELVWVDPERYRVNPYGPDWLPIIKEPSADDSCRYLNKLDSLESVPTKPKDSESAHYVLTVEPLFSLATVNQSIIDFEIGQSNNKPRLFPKRIAKKYCFPDL